jgi:RNA polymerase sigma-70 factor (ECF subfamily)
VFLTVHRRSSSYDSGRSALETWLFGILLRVARNYRRSLRRRLSRLVSWSDDYAGQAACSAAEGPADLVAKRQAARLLDQLLDTLDQDKRAVLVLVELEQFSVPQAAEALGVNVNTAYWRLSAARRSFQAAVERLRAAERRRAGGVSL